MAPHSTSKGGQPQKRADREMEGTIASAIPDQAIVTIFPCLESKPGSTSLIGIEDVPFDHAPRLRAWSQQHGVEEAGVFKAAWGLVLSCYAGTEAAIFGVNYLPCSKHVDGRFEICSFPLEEIASILDLARAICTQVQPKDQRRSSERLFNSALLFRDTENVLSLDRSLQHLTDSFEHAIDVSVAVVSGQETMSISLMYSGCVLSTESARNVAHTFAAAVECVLSRDCHTVGSINLLSPRDSEQIHRRAPPMREKPNMCLHELILERARETPDAPAICARDMDLTYAQLDEVSLKLARIFVVRGKVTSDVLVPVCFPKCGLAIVTMIAILRAGGAIVPIDPAHPKERIRIILQKTSRIVAASPETASLFEDLDVTTITVSPSIVETAEASEPADMNHRARPSDPAIVLFTSGSTGTPKGIVHEHASAVSNSAAHGPAMAMGSGATSRVFQYAAFTFDVSMMDIFTTLTRGGCICVPSDEDRLSNLAPTLNAQRAAWSFFTPSVAGLLDPADLPHLRTICLGGEAVTPDVLERWAGSGGGVRCMQCYGPSECGTVVVGDNAPGDLPANFGTFFGAARCWLVRPDDPDRLVPVGAPGELLVEGPTLARGYLQDPERTAAAFIYDPKWARPADGSSGPPRRMYKTGDLLRQHTDGRVSFLGRKDFQVKVRGQRVEVGEVEHHLATHPALALSMVLGPKSGAFAKALVAVVQPRDLPLMSSAKSNELLLLGPKELQHVKCDSENVSKFLRGRVPGYMVPTHWLFVKKMPLNASGKIDRNAINTWILTVDRSQQSLNLEDGHVGQLISDPKSTMYRVSEEAARIVAREDERLQEELTGKDFILSRAGLDSVQAMSLSMLIRRQYNVKLPIGSIVHPDTTVRSLAEAVDRSRLEGSTGNIKPVFDITAELQRYEDVLTGILQDTERPQRNVFMTGVTGFLGPHILSLLLSDDQIDRVFLHVRASSQQAAWQRLEQLLGAEAWWTDARRSRTEVWPGDLALPRLGLADDLWRRLSGQAARAQCVTDVIHNGAAVLWNADFAALRATNVDSTVELLRAAAAAGPSLACFVYVSGGQYPRPGPEHDDAALVAEMAAANGYAQTKYVAETLVKRFARAPAGRTRRVAVVKPGYIVGDPERGVANERDFLWRLAASCIDIGAYSDADGDSWLPIADVTGVARAVVGCLDQDSAAEGAGEPLVVKVLDGLLVRDFWKVLREDLGYGLEPKDHSTWMALLHQEIKAHGPTHRLWPLLDTLETNNGSFGAPSEAGTYPSTGKEKATALIKQNMRFLNITGFVKARHVSNMINGQEQKIEIDWE